MEAFRIAEAVDLGLDLHHRPRHTVDQDDVAPQPGLRAVVVELGAVGLEGDVGQGDRHVVVALRQQRLFGVVVQVVLGGETGVGVLGRVVDAVVVVPQRAGRLEVREVVLLPVVRRGDVAGVAVVLRQRGRTVQVGGDLDRGAERRVRGRQLVVHRHHDLGALAHLDRRSGDVPAVAEDRRLVAGGDHGGTRLGLDVVVRGVADRLVRLDHRRSDKRCGVGLRHLARRELADRRAAHLPAERQAQAGGAHRTQAGELQHVTS